MADSDSTYENEAGNPRDIRNQLSEANKNVASKDKTIASQQAEIDSYRRRDIFRSAGLDPNRKDVQYMMKAYDGELDIDAVREEASLAGFLREDSFEQEDPRDLSFMQNAAAEQRIAATGQGGDPISSQDPLQKIRDFKDPDALRAHMASLGVEWNAAS